MDETPSTDSRKLIALFYSFNTNFNIKAETGLNILRLI